MKKLFTSMALGLSLLFAGSLALAQTVAPADASAVAVQAAPVAEAVAVAVVEAAEAAIKETVDKGDVTWMMISTVLVTMMVIPGLALFYGGLVRSKNMLSVLMQVMVVFSMIAVLWAIYGYSLAFGGEGLIYGNFDKLFLMGVTPDSLVATFTPGTADIGINGNTVIVPHMNENKIGAYNLP